MIQFLIIYRTIEGLTLFEMSNDVSAWKTANPLLEAYYTHFPLLKLSEGQSDFNKIVAQLTGKTIEQIKDFYNKENSHKNGFSLIEAATILLILDTSGTKEEIATRIFNVIININL